MIGRAWRAYYQPLNLDTDMQHIFSAYTVLPYLLELILLLNKRKIWYMPPM